MYTFCGVVVMPRRRMNAILCNLFRGLLYYSRRPTHTYQQEKVNLPDDKLRLLVALRRLRLLNTALLVTR